MEAIAGTSLFLYGGLSLGTDPNSTATYQLDDSAPVEFPLSGAPTTDGDMTVLGGWNNQRLFNVSNLDVGEHTVVVTSIGASTSGPLAINYFCVTSLTALEQESLGVPPLTQSPTPTSTQILIEHSPHAVPIIEAALCAVLPALLLIVLSIIWYRRKVKHKRELKLSTASPFRSRNSDSITTPFTFRDIILRPSSKLGEKVLAFSTTPVVNSGEVDFCFDIFE